MRIVQKFEERTEIWKYMKQMSGKGGWSSLLSFFLNKRSKIDFIRRDLENLIGVCFNSVQFISVM
jgi:hypothetical protein